MFMHALFTLNKKASMTIVPVIVGIFAATLSLGTTMTASFAETNQMDQTRDQAQIRNPPYA